MFIAFHTSFHKYYFILLMMDHMFSIGRNSEEAVSHSINLVSLKSFLARWTIIKFAKCERTGVA